MWRTSFKQRLGERSLMENHFSVDLITKVTNRAQALALLPPLPGGVRNKYNFRKMLI